MKHESTALMNAKASVEMAGRVVHLLAKYRPQIEDACSRGLGTHSFDDVVAQLMSGDYHIMEEGDCFWIAQVQQYPRVKLYHVFISGGKLSAVKAAIPKMRDAARAAGAAKLTMAGRVGWKRIFEPLGAKTTQITMEMDPWAEC